MLTDSRLRAAIPDRSDRPRAIVIGSGFGGLAAAVRLGAKGYRVTVLERLEAPGGRAYVFREGGYTFDGGPTIITAPFLFEELWTMCGRRMADDVDLRPVDPFYTIRFDDGSQFRYPGDQAAMEAEVARFSPADLGGYRRFMKYSAELCRVAFEELGAAAFDKFSAMAKVAPDLIRLQGHQSVYGVVSRFMRDPRLRVVFSFHPLLIGGNPFSASAVYALIPHLEQTWGVHFARGGTGEIVRGLVDLIRGQGGEVIFEADVEEILVEGGRAVGVRLTTGETTRADIVVSNADAATTYAEMISPAVARKWTPRRVERARHSMGLFVWYFGTRRRFDAVGHHTIVLGPRYEELLKDIFTRKKLAADFSLYLHRPTASDPSLAPPGCDAFYVLSPTPNLLGDVDWTREAEPYRQRIAQRLSETLLPGFEDDIVVSKMLTPLDFKTRLRAHQGSAFSLEPVLTQSAWFRPHNRSETIDNLYLVGAGTHPGAGLPGVLSSARVLDRYLGAVDARS